MGLAVWDTWRVPHFIFNSRTGCEKYAHRTAETWEQAGSLCLWLQAAWAQHEGALATFPILGKWRPQIKFLGTTQYCGVLSTGMYTLFRWKSLVLRSYISMPCFQSLIQSQPHEACAHQEPARPVLPSPRWLRGPQRGIHDAHGGCPTVTVRNMKGNMVRHIFWKKGIHSLPVESPRSKVYIPTGTWASPPWSEVDVLEQSKAWDRNDPVLENKRCTAHYASKSIFLKIPAATTGTPCIWTQCPLRTMLWFCDAPYVIANSGRSDGRGAAIMQNRLINQATPAECVSDETQTPGRVNIHWLMF